MSRKKEPLPEPEQLRSLADEARGARDLVQGLVDYTRAGQNAAHDDIDLDARPEHDPDRI